MWSIPAQMVTAWLVIAAVLLFIEASTAALTTIWFVVGSVAALVCALLGAGFAVQVGVFVGVSALMLLLLRPIAMKLMGNKKPERTNAPALIGRDALVTEPIQNVLSTGQVQVDGQIWSARSAREGVDFAKGEIVRIVSISGVKLLVERKPQREEREE